MDLIKKALFYGIVAAATIVASEFIIHAAAALSPTLRSLVFIYSTEPMMIPSERLGMAGNPRHPGLDRNGYRNNEIADSYDIVALGDSHTFGTTVDISEAWPNLLDSSSEYSVYNMGLGGYGTVHSLLLYDDAIKFDPQLIIIGVYFGNDFYDNFRLDFGTDRFSLLTERERELIERLETEETIAEKVSFLFDFGASQDDEQDTRSIRRFLSQESGLYGMLRAIKNIAVPPVSDEATILVPNFEDAASALTEKQRMLATPFDGNEWRTILTAPYRLAVEDRDDPRIAYGFHVALEALRAIRDRAESDDVELLVVLLPTKEYVFQERVFGADSHSAFDSLISWEETSRNQVAAFLMHEGISFVDPAPILIDSIQQPYFENADGHPNALGHKLIMELIHEHLDQLLE
jgi:hypothetical protein